MAKKKQKKQKDGAKFEYSNEVVGVLLILFSIIGIGGYGPAGSFIRSFGVFLVGIVYPLFLIFLLGIGVYLILKRKVPDLINSRMIGLYVLVIAFLVLLHMKYVNELQGQAIITETLDSVMKTFKNSDMIDNCGGGMIGALFGYLFYVSFKDGVYIVLITMLIIGVVLFFNTSIAKFLSKIKINKKKEKKNDVPISNGDSSKSEPDEVKEDKRIVISSVDELTKVKDNEVSSNKEVPIVKNDDIVLPPANENEVPINTDYKLPPISLLKASKNVSSKENEINAKSSISKLEEILKVFDISGKIVQVNIGPTVTQYELELKAGTKVSKLLSIQREIALALAAKDVRIQAPIPGKNTIGIELPNKVNAPVSFKEVFSNMPPITDKTLLSVGLGKDIMGKVRYCEINTTPHMLVAGSTGSGKSVCINSIIVSILMRTKPEEVKLVLVDPKKVELSMYNGVPHLLAPVVTDPKKANIALKKIVVEMENRYDIFSNNGVKNIEGYNNMIDRKNESLPDGEKLKRMPFIVVIIDELADLMLVAAKEVEDSIMRITQMARAAGIHLIVATQRPSTDVITGVVKANIPSRISFAVSSQIDSRTILDAGGAEKLLGKGDMLFLPMGANSPTRIQGAYVSDEEIQAIVDYTISQQKAIYDESLTIDRGSSSSSSASDDNYESSDEYDDPLYNEIVDFAVRTGKISASLIQRKYRLGYNRAARIIDLLEERGIIGPQNGSKPREVLVKLENNNNEE